MRYVIGFFLYRGILRTVDNIRSTLFPRASSPDDEPLVAEEEDRTTVTPKTPTKAAAIPSVGKENKKKSQ